MYLHLRPREECYRQMKVFYSENAECISVNTDYFFLKRRLAVIHLSKRVLLLDLCVRTVVLAVRLFTFPRSMTTPWSQRAWTMTLGRWFPAWTSCWPKLWRNTESRATLTLQTQMLGSGWPADWHADRSGRFRHPATTASLLCCRKQFQSNFYSPSGILHCWLWGEWLQKLRWCEGTGTAPDFCPQRVPMFVCLILIFKGCLPENGIVPATGNVDRQKSTMIKLVKCILKSILTLWL